MSAATALAAWWGQKSELYGRALVVNTGEQYATRLVPSSQRMRGTPYEKAEGPVVSASLRLRQRRERLSAV